MSGGRPVALRWTCRHEEWSASGLTLSIAQGAPSGGESTTQVFRGQGHHSKDAPAVDRRGWRGALIVGTSTQESSRAGPQAQTEKAGNVSRRVQLAGGINRLRAELAVGRAVGRGRTSMHPRPILWRTAKSAQSVPVCKLWSAEPLISNTRSIVWLSEKLPFPRRLRA